MTEVVEENRDLIERHIEKNGPASDLAEILLEVADSEN
jgi:hypothetical protein